MAKIVKPSEVLNERPPAGIRVRCGNCHTQVETTGDDKDCRVDLGYESGQVYSWLLDCGCGKSLRIPGPGKFLAEERYAEAARRASAKENGFFRRIWRRLFGKVLDEKPLEDEPCRFLNEISEAIEKLLSALFHAQEDLKELKDKNLLSDAGKRIVTEGYIQSCKEQLKKLADLRLRQEAIIDKLAKSIIPPLPTVNSLDLELEIDDPVKKLEAIVGAYEEIADSASQQTTQQLPFSKQPENKVTART